MKFLHSQKEIKKLLLATLLILSLSSVHNYNLDSFEYIYETDTTKTTNIFNGANIVCSDVDGVTKAKVNYFISTSDNFNNVVKFYENELSGHSSTTMTKGGFVILFDYSLFTSSSFEFKDGRYVYTIKLKDIYPNANYPDVTLILNETKDADDKIISSCISKIQEQKKTQAAAQQAQTQAPAQAPATQPDTTQQQQTPQQAPAPAQAPAQADPPKTDPPQTDPPKTDPPQTDPPKTDPPQTDPPKTDPPQQRKRLEKVSENFGRKSDSSFNKKLSVEKSHQVSLSVQKSNDKEDIDLETNDRKGNKGKGKASLK